MYFGYYFINASGSFFRERWQGHRLTTSSSETESQSAMMNLTTSLTEQLSSTLQACLRTSVCQLAFPLPNHRHHQHLPYSSASTNAPNVSYNDDFAVASAVSRVSPLRTVGLLFIHRRSLYASLGGLL